MKELINLENSEWLVFYTNDSSHSYSKKEIATIYELARFSLENGDIHRAETLLIGLTTVVPNFIPAWLGLAYVHIQNENDDKALQATKIAYNYAPEKVEVILFYVSCLLSCGDINDAGTHLGEVTDKIENGTLLSPDVSRFYHLQMARYQALV